MGSSRLAGDRIEHPVSVDEPFRAHKPPLELGDMEGPTDFVLAVTAPNVGSYAALMARLISDNLRAVTITATAIRK